MYKSDSFLVKNYVAEYLINNYGPDIVIPDSHFIMTAWRICATRNKRKYDRMLGGRKLKKEFGEESMVLVSITLSYNTYHSFGYQLTPTEEMIFRTMLSELVKEKLSLTHTIASKLKQGVTDRETMNIFREVTNLTEESFTSDGIKKYLYRQRKAAKRKAEAQAQQSKPLTLF